MQVNQDDLLKYLNQGKGVPSVLEIRCTTDLTVRATARTIVRSLAAIVATKGHLWLKLLRIKEREKSFLLEAPVLLFRLFATAIEMVFKIFREAKAQIVAFEKYICRSQGPSASYSYPVAGPSWRQGQKASVAAHACRWPFSMSVTSSDCHSQSEIGMYAYVFQKIIWQENFIYIIYASWKKLS